MEENTLETSGEDAKLKKKKVVKNNCEVEYLEDGTKRLSLCKNYTRNEWRRCKTTLETSGEDVKLHSKRVEKFSGRP